MAVKILSMKNWNVLFFCLFSAFYFSQESKNVSLDFLKENNFQTEISLRKESPKVTVLETCSTKANLCGTSAFGSLSLVKILTGKYADQKIYLATTCKETQYKVGKTYQLDISNAPNFSVILCNNKIYNPDWNSKLKENNHLLFFGNLKE